jgi:hypothetical protein
MKLVPRDHEQSGLGSCAKMLDRGSNCGQQKQQPPDETNHTPRCPRCDGTQPDPTRVVAGFGSWILAPVDAALPLPPEIPLETALLIEPFAASLNAVMTIAPRPGETIAVLGPRRLGLLVVAALAGHRKRSSLDFRILAISRHEPLLELARRFGTTDTLLSSGRGDSLPDGLADVVIDTTASPAGLDLAVRLTRREVHLKSTHGQPAAGLANLTALVVDEIVLARLPEEADAGRDWLWTLAAGPGTTRRPAKVAWLADAEPPGWLASADARLVRGGDAAELLAGYERSAETGELPRADAAVVQSGEQVDRAIRPSEASELSLVRPRGEIVLPGSSQLRVADSPLLRAVAGRGLRLSLGARPLRAAAVSRALGAVAGAGRASRRSGTGGPHRHQTSAPSSRVRTPSRSTKSWPSCSAATSGWFAAPRRAKWSLSCTRWTGRSTRGASRFDHCVRMSI